MIDKKTKGFIKKTNGGSGRVFVFSGAVVWIPAAFFVLLVLFQMVPLPAEVLKVVSPATHELYEEILPEVGGRLATDPHRPTQTFVRRTPVPSAGATGQASPDKNSHRFAKIQKSEGREKDEHRTPAVLAPGRGRSNIEHPTSNEKRLGDVAT